MGEYMDIPEENPELRDEKNKLIKYGLYKVQGHKNSMQDFVLSSIKLNNKKYPRIYAVFGLFDGHGGEEVSHYLSVHFLEYLEKSIEFLGKKEIIKNSKEIRNVIKSTFLDLDKSLMTDSAKEELISYSKNEIIDEDQEREDIKNFCSDEKFNDDELDKIMEFNQIFNPRNIENINIAEYSGSSGMIILFSDDTIYIASVGNSRCLLFDKEGNYIESTRIHTMKEKDEKKRVDIIRTFNKEIKKSKNKGSGIDQYIDCTRGFGDWELKQNPWIGQEEQEISVDPDIFEKNINDIGYIIFGSNGMFDRDEINDNIIKNIGNELIGKIIGTKGRYSETLKEYFKNVLDKAKEDKKKLDNISCFAIKIYHQEFEVLKENNIKSKNEELEILKEEEKNKNKNKNDKIQKNIIDNDEKYVEGDNIINDN